MPILYKIVVVSALVILGPLHAGEGNVDKPGLGFYFRGPACVLCTHERTCVMICALF